MRSRLLKFIVATASLAALLVGIGAWRVMRTDEVPKQLEAVVGDPATITIPGLGTAPPLVVGDLKGKRAFFVYVGVASLGAKEGKTLNRALNRWVFPKDTVGYIVFDAEDLGFFRDKAQEYADRVAVESRFPLYGDFEGVFGRTLALPKGHHAIVVLDENGEILLRHSGGLKDPELLETLQGLLGATEPPLGPQAPRFEAGPLNNDSCAGKACALLFLSQKVTKADLPGKGGFEAEGDEMWDHMRQPHIRMTATALKTKFADKSAGVVVGQTEGLEFPTWSQIEQAPQAAQALGVDPTRTTLVIIDAQGRIALHESGVFPIYQMGAIEDLLGVEVEFEP